MTNEYDTIIKDLDILYDKLKEETSECGLDIVSKIVDLEVEAEKFCNQ